MEDFTLRGSLQKYRRMRGWRVFAAGAALPLGLAAAWFFGLSRTDTLLCAVGAGLAGLIAHLEVRLKVMQVRLAGVADELDALRGKESEDNLITELSDW